MTCRHDWIFAWRDHSHAWVCDRCGEYRDAPLGECGYDEPHEPHTYVLAENDRPTDHECPGLAAPADAPCGLCGESRDDSDHGLGGSHAPTPPDAPDVRGELLERIKVRLSREAEGNVYLDIAFVGSVLDEEFAAALAPTPPDALREAARAVVEAWTDDESGMETFDPEVIDRLAAALEETP